VTRTTTPPAVLEGCASSVVTWCRTWANGSD
jgi:hypothetical protein